MGDIAEVGSAFITIAPSLKGFGGALNAQAGGTIRSSGKSLGAAFGKAFVLGGSLLAAAGIGSFLKDSIGEAREAQKVGALTENVIKSTGKAANISAKQVGNLATSLSLKTGIDDEAIQSGSNLLLTFKNVKREGKGLNDVFGRATAAAVDLSASGFGDINGASKQLGKALNDPIKGITALSRSGVTFTDQQKAQIQTLVKSGKTLDAQKIILAEVESQVGGAAAATSTYGEKAKVAFGNIKEQVGTKLLPVIDGIAKAFLRAVPTITRLIDGIGPAFGRVQAFLAPVIAQFGGGAGLQSRLLSVATTIKTTFLPVLQAAANTFITTILPAVLRLASYLSSTFGPVLAGIGDIVKNRILPIYSSLAQFFYNSVLPVIVQVAGVVARNLKPVFDQLAETFRSDVLPTVDKLTGAFQRNQPQIQKVALAIVKAAGAAVIFGAKIIGTVLPPVIRFAGFLIRNAVPAIANLIRGLVTGVQRIIAFGQAVVNGAQAVAEFAGKVRAKIAEVVGFFKALPSRVLNALAALPGKLLTIGGQIVDGLARGIRASAGKVLDAVKNLIDRIPKKIRDIMGIASPSKVTTKLGEQTGEGLAKGLTNAQKKVRAANKRLIDSVRDDLRDRLSGLRDDFASLSDSVQTNLVGNLFGDATTASGLVANLTTAKGNVAALLSAFKTLRGFGLPSAFLAQLFSDGGAPLILDLANNKDQAKAASSLFGDIQSLSTDLGNAVASEKLGDKIDETNAQLAKLVSLSGGAAADFARTLNGQAAKGKRNQKSGGKKGGR